jgi:hypothetical protein
MSGSWFQRPRLNMTEKRRMDDYDISIWDLYQEAWQYDGFVRNVHKLFHDKTKRHNLKDSRPGLPYFSWYKIRKRENTYQIILKYTKWPQNIPNCVIIDQIAIKSTSIFLCKTLQNLPKLEFLVWKYAIWQHYSRQKFWTLWRRFHWYEVFFKTDCVKFWTWAWTFVRRYKVL